MHLAYFGCSNSKYSSLLDKFDGEGHFRKRHEKIHFEDKEFSCKFCGKSFVQKVNMEAHERIHTGEKPLVCLLMITSVDVCAYCIAPDNK